MEPDTNVLSMRASKRMCNWEMETEASRYVTTSEF